MDYFEMVEDAWSLSDSVRSYIKNAGHAVDVEEVWEKVFALSPLVDLVRSRNEGGSPLSRIFLKSPYGLYYRADSQDWIPFRHTEISV
jgi:hypothetical protein